MSLTSEEISCPHVVLVHITDNRPGAFNTSLTNSLPKYMNECV